ncbi:MAG: ABC transporter permease [Candidatus Brocadiia bacterium]
MQAATARRLAARFLADYGMVFALVALCAYFSYATLDEQFPTGREAAHEVSQTAARRLGREATVVIAAHTGEQAAAFAQAAREGLERRGIEVLATVAGGPPQLGRELDRMAAEGPVPEAIVATCQVARWPLLQDVAQRWPALAGVQVVAPRSTWWPDFLKRSNLVAIADRIVVIAILAIGMTMVIITAGIDLSVGSLIALSAVLSMVLVRDVAGAAEASGAGMVLCCLAGVAACGAVGLFSGAMVAFFSIPPFIVTLAMMQVARGLAFILARGQSVYRVPASIDWLGRGSGPLGIPNTVTLMVVLYAAAHVVMARTVLGRYIYAVGGNAEAARLSGVPVRRVVLFVYAMSGLLAGLGGVVQASQLRTGDPKYGTTYELYVIAAVVVGGTSLAGGQGKIFGTLIGAFIIAVIQNGMNLTRVENYTQMVVLGFVILGAVLLDMLKGRGGRLRALLRRRRAPPPQ